MGRYRSGREYVGELVDVVRYHGPLPLADVARRYQATYHKNLNLGGRKLRDLEDEGILEGALRINSETHELVLWERWGNSSKASSSCLDEPSVSYHLIDSVQSCTQALIDFAPEDSDGDTVSLSLKRICEGRSVAVELEGSGMGSEEAKISLVKIAASWSPAEAVIFDVGALEAATTGRTLLRAQLGPLLEDESSVKVVHDFNNGGIALRRHFGPALKIYSLFDTQLAMEVLLGDVHMDLDCTLTAFSEENDSGSDGPHRRRASDNSTVGASRPIDPRTLSRAAQSVTSLAKAAEAMMAKGLDEEQNNQVLQASKLKNDNAMATLDAARRMSFRDHGSCSGGGVGRMLISHELKEVQEEAVDGVSGKDVETMGLFDLRSTGRRVGPVLERTQPVEDATPAVKDANSPREVLQLIPEVFLEEHLSTRETKNLQDLQDVVLDEGRRPKALLQGRGNVFLCSDPNIVVTPEDIDRVVGKLEQDGKFGDDNRAGFPDQLHRVSVLRRKHDRKIIGVTLRIGRFFKGSAGLIDDLLFPVSEPSGKPQRAPSILVLGVPGSGKTTAIRDICRKISATQTVMIVDTSNEIAGDGDTPHREAIGESRRIMVPNKKDQHRVMTEALQNHTPRTIVVDEISDDKEACACLDIKERGVRVVASAHGDFRSILKNPKLNTLVGGKTTVTVGDGLAKKNGGNKVQTQRAGAPIFDTIIELKRGDVNEWRIIRDVGAAVDALLSGGSYEVERRTRLTQDSMPEHKVHLGETCEVWCSICLAFN
eukprot:jgi/Undpi1/5311/HiC_scaffold_2.g00592.m1